VMNGPGQNRRILHVDAQSATAQQATAPGTAFATGQAVAVSAPVAAAVPAVPAARPAAPSALATPPAKPGVTATPASPTSMDGRPTFNTSGSSNGEMIGFGLRTVFGPRQEKRAKRGPVLCPER